MPLTANPNTDPSSLWEYPYPSRRMPVMGANVVATSQPLAAQAGLRMLQQGGNAVDAALAAAIALSVVEPTGNGLGSDAFALVWDGAQLHGFNGSGRAPAAWTPLRFSGLDAVPRYGWDAVTVPGAVDAWVRLSARFGRLPFADLCAPAIHYARQGFAVSPFVARRWAESVADYRAFTEFAATFLPGGRAPRPGEIFRCPELARSLEAVADSQGAAFYQGELAAATAAAAARQGGALTREDLADHRGEWVTPLTVAYRGIEVHEIPPNGQGLATLVALGVLAQFDLAHHPVDSPASLHLQIEAMKIGIDWAARHIADPDWMTVDPAELLAPAQLAQAAGAIHATRASRRPAALPTDGGTVYLAAADEAGWMVSFIQSNFTGFGSGVVIPGTGISLQNRGCGFTLAPGHPNAAAGGKRPFHTIIPAFATRGGQPLLSFGVMGGHMQPQGHVQLVVRLADYGQNPQAACDAPRWHICENGCVALEAGTPEATRRQLSEWGHVLQTEDPVWGYGGAQLILKTGATYCAASDSRKDGQAVAF
jgi:gamma-glutamyltranspeptidase/glutathione hydrolase